MNKTLTLSTCSPRTKAPNGEPIRNEHRELWSDCHSIPTASWRNPFIYLSTVIPTPLTFLGRQRTTDSQIHRKSRLHPVTPNPRIPIIDSVHFYARGTLQGAKGFPRGSLVLEALFRGEHVEYARVLFTGMLSPDLSLAIGTINGRQFRGQGLSGGCPVILPQYDLNCTASSQGMCRSIYSSRCLLFSPYKILTRHPRIHFVVWDERTIVKLHTP